MRNKASLKTEIIESDSEPLPLEPSPNALKVKPGKLITLRDVEDASRRVGLEVVNAKNITHYQVLGEYLEQEGAVAVGRGMLLMTHQHVTSGLKKCSDLLADETSLEIVDMLLKDLVGLAGLQLRVANSLIESDKRSDAVNKSQEQTVQGPPPLQTIVPIHSSCVTIIPGTAPK